MATNRNEESGVILKIQKRSGCLLFVIGAAMLAFVLTDLLGSGQSIFMGQQKNIVGEIAGEEISYEAFDQRVNEIKELYTRNGANYPEEQFRDMAWNQLLQEKVFKKEQYALGLQLTAEEFIDLTTGDNTDPMIIRNFQRPEDQGKPFNKQTLIKFLEVDIQDDPAKMASWINLVEKPLIDQTESKKYDKMVKSAVYATKLDAQASFDLEHVNISGQAVSLPYSNIADSTINYTDSDLKAYMAENESKYQQEASRDINYVVLNVIPSAKDSLNKKNDVSKLISRFQITKDDSAFIQMYYSTEAYNPLAMPRGSFSPSIEDKLFNAPLDTVIGPFLNKEKGTYGVYKVIAEEQDSIAIMRAAHILLPSTADIDEDKSKAEKLISDLRSGTKDFETEAKNNYDGTGNTGGDLGWLKKDGFASTPQELRTELFNHSLGEYFYVKTSKGVHVVKVTGGKTYRKIQVAALEKKIVPGSETDRAVEKAAGEIQYLATTDEDFEKVAETSGTRVRIALNITAENPSISGITNPQDVKTLTKWLYDDKREENDISDVYRLENKYVVAKVMAIREEGAATLDDMREGVVNDYIRDQKAKTLKKQMEDALASNKEPQAFADAIGSIVREIPAVSFMSPNIPGVGDEGKLKGKLFALEAGEHTEPTQGNTGVFVVWSKGEVTVGDKPELEMEAKKTDVLMETNQYLDGGVLDAIREAGKVKDYRYKFF